MAGRIARGEISQYSLSNPDNRRLVLVITRSKVIDLLHTVMIAPITSTIHGAPGEGVVGIDEGLKQNSAVNLDHVQTVDKSGLTRFVGTVGAHKMRSVCRTLAMATGCDDAANQPLTAG